MKKPSILVFNSGSGSGFEKLVQYGIDGIASYHIVGLVVSSFECKAIERAKRLGIKYTVMTSFRVEDYQKVASEYNPDFFSLSGWLKLVKGLDPKITFNIHPGSLPNFGGHKMYGHYVHEATIAAYKAGNIKYTEICMHFITNVEYTSTAEQKKQYDKGSVFFRFSIRILDTDTAETLSARVNKWEHFWQPFITDLIAKKEIYWDDQTLVIPGFVQTINNRGLVEV
jgi:phosphoribosylglycinamide formyltransferase 1